MESLEATAIHLAQEVALGDAENDDLMEHLNTKFLDTELQTLARAAWILAQSADQAHGTDEL